jgi:hypothetical protein
MKPAGSERNMAAAKCESSGGIPGVGSGGTDAGSEGDDGYAGMPPRSNVDASPEARTLPTNVTGKPLRRSLAPALPCALRPPMNDEAAD